MDNQVVRVILGLAEDVGTPRALAVSLLVRHGEWAELQKLRVRPQDYLDGEAYWRDNLVTEFLRKCDLPTSVDREAAAVQTFLECEHQNCTTNARLSRFLPHKSLYETEGDLRVADFISQWRKDISYVLGNLPDHLTPRFSPGATYADTGHYKTTPDKMSSTPTIYDSCRDIIPLWGETAWCRALLRERPWSSDPRTVRGNIFFTVPKDGTKFRGCCKEASIPITYQLAVGDLMKKRLHRIGIDLRQGQDLHRKLAQRASVDQSLATIDMSNASDTLCRVLPELCLPRGWFVLLDSLRAKNTQVKGRWYRLEKFSSMGNGFTFELETLIFATLARTVIAGEGGDPDLVRCYGDDLIVPSNHYRSVVAALRWFGFTPNMKKTFAEGPFRESCGGDFWDGVPVRAHYLEELPDEPQHWISLANGLRRVARANDRTGTRWSTVRRAWLRALDPIPSHIRRCTGPEHLGDIVIHDEPEVWTKHARRASDFPKGRARDALGIHESHEGFWVSAYMPVPTVLPWHHWTPAVQLAAATLGLPSRGVTPRDGVSGFRVGWVNSTLTNQWEPRSLIRD